MAAVSFTYVSGEKPDFGDYPSEKLIRHIAVALETDEDELLILVTKIPERIRQRVLVRPDAFSRLAELDDRELARVLRELEE